MRRCYLLAIVMFWIGSIGRPLVSAIQEIGSLGRLVGGVPTSLDRRRVGGVPTRCLG